MNELTETLFWYVYSSWPCLDGIWVLRSKGRVQNYKWKMLINIWVHPHHMTTCIQFEGIKNTYEVILHCLIQLVEYSEPMQLHNVKTDDAHCKSSSPASPKDTYKWKNKPSKPDLISVFEIPHHNMLLVYYKHTCCLLVYSVCY